MFDPYHWYLRLSGNPGFRGLAADPDLRARWTRLPEPARVSYVLMLTPRSGSSWLGDLLIRTGRLGLPWEYYNPLIVPGVAKGMNVDSLDDYVDMLPRRRKQGDVYGLRVTYHHMIQTFGTEARFHAAHRGAAYFWLVREDLVAQAVSASRMVQTDLRHLSGADPDARRAADARFVYRARDIRRRLRYLAWLERRTESYFQRFGITPHRLSYEGLFARPPQAVAQYFADRLGVSLPDDGFDSAQRKVSTGKSAEFADRFRRENRAFLAGLETKRAPLIAALPGKAS